MTSPAERLDVETSKMVAEIDDGIGWMTFNNPERRNAVSLDMWEAIAQILEHFQGNPEVRVVVMRGAGDRAFVSGADISEFDDKRSDSRQQETYAAIQARAQRWLAQLEKPLLAMIHGYCIGGGLATALAADVRFASSDATFGIPAAKLGLGYAYPGTSNLADLVGPAVAKDMLFSARFLDAEEALRVGLVNYVVAADELETRVRTYALQVAANAPLTVKAAKFAVDQSRLDPERRDMGRLETLIDACFDSEDYEEGRRAFAEKRPPAFKGR